MATQRLPVPGGDNGTWGSILNGFLGVSLNADGTIQGSALTQAGGVTTSQVGQAGGVASLNNSGLVPSTQLGTSTANSSTYLRGDGMWSTPVSGGDQALVPTAVKTSAYTAAAADFIPVDTTSGAVTITLPTTPADKTRIGIKLIKQGSTNAVTINAGGSDVFNKNGGVNAETLSLLNQGVLLQYATTPAIWYIQSDDLSLSQLDSRYLAVNGGTSTGPITAQVIDKGGSVFNIQAYGAVADSVSHTDGSMSSSSAVFTSASATFTSADVGKLIAIPGVGASGGLPLVTTIASYQSATQVTLATTASTTASGQTYWYGTNNAPFMTATANAMTNGGIMYIPATTTPFLFAGGLTLAHNNLVIRGEGIGSSQLLCAYMLDRSTNGITITGGGVGAEYLSLSNATPITSVTRSGLGGGAINNGDLIRLGGGTHPSGSFADKVWADHCSFNGAYSSGCEIQSATRASITNCYADSNDGNGLGMSDILEYALFTGNVVTNGGDDMIILVADAGVTNPNSATLRVIITDNICEGGSAKGIGCVGADHVIITGNHIRDTWAEGVGLLSGDGLGYTTRCIVADNTLKDIGTHFGPTNQGFLHQSAAGGGSAAAINVPASASNVRIHHNFIYNCLQYAILVNNAPASTTTTDTTDTFPVTTLNVASTAGMLPTSDTATIYDPTTGLETQFSYTGVTATSLTGCTGGIGTFTQNSLVNTPTSYISIQGNSIRGALQSAIAIPGISSSDYLQAWEIVVSGNDMREVAAGIAIGAASHVIIEGNIIRSYLNSEGGVSGAYRGISINGIRYATVASNQIANSDGSGSNVPIIIPRTSPNLREWGNSTYLTMNTTDTSNVWDVAQTVTARTRLGAVGSSGEPGIALGSSLDAGFYRSGANAISTLGSSTLAVASLAPSSTNNQVLTTSSGVASWQTPSVSGGGIAAGNATLITSSETYTVPVTGTYEIVCVSGGSGGGGGGSAALTGGVSAQAGGGGGAAGGVAIAQYSLTAAASLTVTVGSGGVGAGGGTASSGATGTIGGTGGSSGASIVTGTGVSITSPGAAGGVGSAGNSNSGGVGGNNIGVARVLTPTSSGGGGGGGGVGAAGTGYMCGGGGGGGAANSATLGGGGGGAGTAVTSAGSAGTAAASGTTTGLNGTAAAANSGGGGGGGGGGAPGGAGGAGGAGGSGFVIIRLVG